MLNRKASFVTTFIIACIMVIACNPGVVKAETATTITLSISPTTAEHSSISNPYGTVGTLEISLTAGGVGLSQRPINFYCRAVGADSWTLIGTPYTDTSGRIASPFAIESFVPDCGEYEFKVEYAPSGADVGVYAASTSNIVKTTLYAHELESTTLSVSITPNTMAHSSASQFPEPQLLQITLSSGGSPLASRPIVLNWREVGDSSWNYIATVSTDSSGQYSVASFYTEGFVGGRIGTFEFQAVYTPDSWDATGYTGSNGIATFTITPHVIEATTLTLVITPDTVEHTSAAQGPASQSFLLTLSSGGNPLAYRTVAFNWRPVGASEWNSISQMETDISGQIPASAFSTEAFVTDCGVYEFQAVYTPNAYDATDYFGSEAICTVTLVPASLDQSTITINNHQGSESHLTTTGVAVDISDTTLANGFELTFTSKKFDSNLPPSTSAFSVSGNTYYDVQVLPPGGVTLGSDVLVTVTITDSSFTPGSTVQYWDGSSWQPVTSNFIAPNTVSFTVEASLLSGTPFVVHHDTILATPEYPVGIIFAVGACFAAVAVFKWNKKPTLHR